MPGPKCSQLTDWQCYIKADEDSALTAAEVYGGDNGVVDDDDENELLNVPPAPNTLNLVSSQLPDVLPTASSALH